MRGVSWVDARRAAAALIGLATLAAYAGSISQPLIVKVNLVSSSGTCTLTGGPQAVGVACGGGGAIPGMPDAPGMPPPAIQPAPVVQTPPSAGQIASFAGGSRFQPVTTFPAAVGIPGPLTVYSGGVNISGWRVVSLDNEKYVELTIAW